jgi:hypothetical protein
VDGAGVLAGAEEAPVSSTCLLCHQPAGPSHDLVACCRAVGDWWRPRRARLDPADVAASIGYHDHPGRKTVSFQFGDTVKTRITQPTPGPLNIVNTIMEPNPAPRRTLLEELHWWMRRLDEAERTRPQAVVSPHVTEGTVLVVDPCGFRGIERQRTLLMHPADADRLRDAHPALAEALGLADIRQPVIDIPVPEEGWDPDPPDPDLETDPEMVDSLRHGMSPTPRWVRDVAVRAMEERSHLFLGGEAHRALRTARSPWRAFGSPYALDGTAGITALYGVRVVLDGRVPDGVVRLIPGSAR